MIDKIYDAIILGTGPSELTAGIYVGRARLDALFIEKGKDGGQAAITGEIENYPGQMVDGESGPSLTGRMIKRAEKFGAGRICDTIISVDIESPVKTLVSSNGTYKAHTLIIVTGAFPRPTGCKGEGGFMGKGASYRTIRDASFFEGLEVFVAGDDGSAIEETMCLAKSTRKVTVIHRRDELCIAKSTQERAFKNPKLFFMWDTVVEKLHRDGIFSGTTVKNVKIGELTKIDAGEDNGLFGVFGFIGHNPRSELLESKLEMGRRYIKIDEDMHINVEGVYAIGDIRVKSLKQVVTTAADGAIASMQVKK